MCFILNIFNSCKTASPKKPSPHAPTNILVNSNNQPGSRANSLTINNRNGDNNIQARSTSQRDKHRSKQNIAEFDSDELTDLEININNNPGVREKLLSTSHRLIHQANKSNSSKKQQAKKSNIEEQTLVETNLKYRNISDYCNDCGYYCCECDQDSTCESVSRRSPSHQTNPSASVLCKQSRESSLNEEEFYNDLNSPYLDFKPEFPTSNTSNSINQLDSPLRKEYSTNNNNYISQYSSSNSITTQKTLTNKLSNESMNSLNNNNNNADIERYLGKLNVSAQSPKLSHIPLKDLKTSIDNISLTDVSKAVLPRPIASGSPKRPMMNMNMGMNMVLGSPKLGLEKVNKKKNTFVFTHSELRPQDDADLSRELEKEKKDTYNRQHKMKHSKGGKITISSNQIFEFKESELRELGQIGNGEFGTVHKALHVPSQTLMAIKRIGPTVGNQVERKKVLKELDFVLNAFENQFVVKFYGVKFNNEPADCLICMELMDTSLEKFYKFVYGTKKEEIPEEILGKVVVATVSALDYLKEKHSIIHRDVKPSNMLVNKHGEIKMCDFGISGKLVDSIAASRDAGCQLYMAVSLIFI